MRDEAEAASAVPADEVRLRAAANALSGDPVLHQPSPAPFASGARVWVLDEGQATVLVARDDVRDNMDQPIYEVRMLDGSTDFVTHDRLQEWSPDFDTEFAIGDLVWDTEFGLRATVVEVTDEYLRSARIYIVSYEPEWRTADAARFDGPERRPGQTARTLGTWLRPWTIEGDAEHRQRFIDSIENSRELRESLRTSMPEN